MSPAENALPIQGPAATRPAEAEEARERRRASIVANIPAWYNPAVHLAIPTRAARAARASEADLVLFVALIP